MATSEEKKALIRRRLCQGVPLEEIAREVGVSKSTVHRVKKTSPVNVLADFEAGDNTIQYDTRPLYTKTEQKYIEKLKSDIWLYEDVEEGWVFHLDKENYLLKTSGLWWVQIVYPESAPKNWIEKLEATGLEVAISPLHDKDRWLHDSPAVVNPETGEIIPKGARYKAGDKKKAHWHVIVKCNVSTSFKEMNNLLRNITNGSYIQKCRSIKNTFDYFTHETDAAKRDGKYRYEKDEIIRLNNFTVTPNKYEIGILQCEIVNTIVEKNITEMWEVAKLYANQPEMMAILWAKPGFITSLVRSQWKKAHPESKVQLTHEVTNEEYQELKGKGE